MPPTTNQGHLAIRIVGKKAVLGELTSLAKTLRLEKDLLTSALSELSALRYKVEAHVSEGKQELTFDGLSVSDVHELFYRLIDEWLACAKCNSMSTEVSSKKMFRCLSCGHKEGPLSWNSERELAVPSGFNAVFGRGIQDVADAPCEPAAARELAPYDVEESERLKLLDLRRELKLLIAGANEATRKAVQAAGVSLPDPATLQTRAHPHPTPEADALDIRTSGEGGNQATLIRKAQEDFAKLAKAGSKENQIAALNGMRGYQIAPEWAFGPNAPIAFKPVKLTATGVEEDASAQVGNDKEYKKAMKPLEYQINELQSAWSNSKSGQWSLPSDLPYPQDLMDGTSKKSWADSVEEDEENEEDKKKRDAVEKEALASAKASMKELTKLLETRNVSLIEDIAPGLTLMVPPKGVEGESEAERKAKLREHTEKAMAAMRSNRSSGSHHSATQTAASLAAIVSKVSAAEPSVRSQASMSSASKTSLKSSMSSGSNEDKVAKRVKWQDEEEAKSNRSNGLPTPPMLDIEAEIEIEDKENVVSQSNVVKEVALKQTPGEAVLNELKPADKAEKEASKPVEEIKAVKEAVKETVQEVDTVDEPVVESKAAVEADAVTEPAKVDIKATLSTTSTPAPATTPAHPSTSADVSETRATAPDAAPLAAKLEKKAASVSAQQAPRTAPIPAKPSSPMTKTRSAMTRSPMKKSSSPPMEQRVPTLQLSPPLGATVSPTFSKPNGLGNRLRGRTKATAARPLTPRKDPVAPRAPLVRSKSLSPAMEELRATVLEQLTVGGSVFVTVPKMVDSQAADLYVPFLHQVKPPREHGYLNTIVITPSPEIMNAVQARVESGRKMPKWIRIVDSGRVMTALTGFHFAHKTRVIIDNASLISESAAKFIATTLKRLGVEYTLMITSCKVMEGTPEAVVVRILAKSLPTIADAPTLTMRINSKGQVVKGQAATKVRSPVKKAAVVIPEGKSARSKPSTPSGAFHVWTHSVLWVHGGRKAETLVALAKSIGWVARELLVLVDEPEQVRRTAQSLTLAGLPARRVGDFDRPDLANLRPNELKELKRRKMEEEAKCAQVAADVLNEKKSTNSLYRHFANAYSNATSAYVIAYDGPAPTGKQYWKRASRLQRRKEEESVSLVTFVDPTSVSDLAGLKVMMDGLGERLAFLPPVPGLDKSHHPRDDDIMEALESILPKKTAHEVYERTQEFAREQAKAIALAEETREASRKAAERNAAGTSPVPPLALGPEAARGRMKRRPPANQRPLNPPTRGRS